MIGTNILREQHDAALAMADQLLDLVDAYQPGQQIFPIVMQLNRVIGLLRVHLANEDVELYPAMIASGDAEVASIAQSYSDDMGGFAIELELFARHWSCSASIVSGFEEFREDAHALLLTLAARIERENRYLYPLAEAMGMAVERRAA